MILSAIKIAVFAAFYSLCLSLNAQTQQLNVVGEYIAGATNYDGTGYQFEMVKAIFEPLGYQVNINVYPYKRALKEVEHGQADMMIGMIRHSNMSTLFSFVPHEADKILAIYRDDNVLNWQGLSTLKNKKLVMLPSISENAKEHLPILNNQVRVVNTPIQALKMLKHGRADFIIMTQAEYRDIDDSEARFKSQIIGFIDIHAAFTDSISGVKFKKVWDEHFISYLKSDKAKSTFNRWGVSKNYVTTLNYLTGTTDETTQFYPLK
jgi:polar amino acid transport system substrate-binding protein